MWQRRSSLGLLGNTINTKTGEWHDRESGIGAGIDSFYEYLFKSYLYFDGSHDHYEMFVEVKIVCHVLRRSLWTNLVW